jgi:hypothetical protein
MEAVQHRQVAFARHAEAGGDALGDQGFDKGVAGKARGGHGRQQET